MSEIEVERYELREEPAFRFQVSRREFLETIGAGLVLSATLAGQSGASTLEARLHLDENGLVTILNGKVEEGQGPRTELAAAAAEELRLPIEKVRVWMADTGLTPNDGITAGSRSTPSTVPAVRRAAAAARQLLERSGKASYAELAKSAESAKMLAQPMPEGIVLTSAKDWKVLGRPALRVNGHDLVTGAHKFPSDIQRPGMLYGAMVRPASFEATLTALDDSAAKKLAGVTVVREGEFAGCVAPSSFQARKAAAVLAAGAQWKEKQHPSSDTLFEHLKAKAKSGSSPKATGDVRAALEGSAKRLKATYTAAYIQHAPMEPRAAVAEWADGKLTVWTGTSNPFAVRDDLAKAFQIAPRKVRVIVPDFGGGFGGKHPGEAALEAARLAKGAGKPVSIRWTRAEEFTWAYARPAALIEIDAALEGKNLHAWSFINYNSGGSAIDTPYRSPNAHIQFVQSESPLRQGSYRALASTANNFARESFIDELAEAAGIEPLEFRLAHLENDRIREVLLAVTKKFGWEKRSKDRKPHQGVGLACGTEKNSVVAACAEVEVDPKTGTPKLLEICEAFECGAILNPANLQAQVEGCIVMGLGAVLREELRFAGGKITNAKFGEYRVPRFRDLPRMDIVLVDKKNADPVGAGETPIIAVAPAMANAVYMATGKRVRSMPFPSRPA